MKNITLYGIPNCDSVRKGRDWLAAHGVDYAFHDFKKQGVPAAQLAAWLAAVGRDTLINRRGPTWRKLDPGLQASVVDDASASALMQAHSSMIKRPVIVWADGTVTVGFDAEGFARRLP